MEFKNTLSPGTMLRQYRVDKVIGQGGFGITYLAYDTELQRNVAIKECYPRDFVAREGTTVIPSSATNAKDYDWAIEKFMDEATTLAKFRHPGIVQVLQILKGENNSGYMVLEYVEGQSLDQWLKSQSTLPPQDQLESVVAPMLDALEAVHNASFTHRDIAPDNIFIRANGEAVLLDFGAAKLTAAQYSKTMNLVVKDGYSAPEQYYAEGRQGPWTDIYAFSATLYRCLSGKKPIDAMARLDAINNGEPDPLTPLEDLGIKGYTSEFIAAIKAGLSPQAKARPQSIEAWREQLLPNRSSSPTVAATQIAKPGAFGAVPKTTKSGGGGKHLGLSLAVIALLAAAGGSGYWFVQQQRLVAEMQAWEQAAAADSVPAYQAFIDKYPESKKLSDARAEISKFSAPWDVAINEPFAGAAGGMVASAETIAVVGSETAAAGEAEQAIVYNFSHSGKMRWKAQPANLGTGFLHAATIMNDGSIAVAGTFIGDGNQQHQGFIGRYSADGQELWSRRFGGPGLDQLLAITKMENGNIVAAGSSSKIVNGPTRGWLLTLSGEGELIKEQFFDISVDGGGVFRSILEAGDGGLVLAGNSGEAHSTSTANFWVMKLASDGSILFNRQFGGRALDQINAIAEGKNGDFYLAGQTESFGTSSLDGIIMHLTADNKLPPKPFLHNGRDDLKGVAVGNDGTVFAVGNSNSNSKSEKAIWLLALSPELGTIKHEQMIVSSPPMNVIGATVLQNGMILTVGNVIDGGNAHVGIRKMETNSSGIGN